MSTFGTIFRVTTFGESHCKGVGAIVDGVPPRMCARAATALISSLSEPGRAPAAEPLPEHARRALTEADIQPQLTRRRPGQSRLTTPRAEKDLVTIMSGTEFGFTLGTPIGLFVPNEDQRPGDYSEMDSIPRPGHADFTYQIKYGTRASSGGGRSSARETIGRVAAGAIAEKFLLETYGTTVNCWVSSIGDVSMPDSAVALADGGRGWTREEIDTHGTLCMLRNPSHWHVVSESEEPDAAQRKKKQMALEIASEEAFLAQYNGGPEALAALAAVPSYADHEGKLYNHAGVEVVAPINLAAWQTDELLPLRCPHPPTCCRMATLIRQVKSEQDSIGGTVACVCRDVPPALGEPVFDRLEAKLAHAMLSLPATKGFEIGSGFGGTVMRGSVHNDPFVQRPASPGPGGVKEPAITTKKNHAGGTLGGISVGTDIYFRVAVKPVSTIGRAQMTSSYGGDDVVLEAKGRHDPCVLPRTPPLVEAMAALVLIDAALMQRTRLGGSETIRDDARTNFNPRAANGHADSSASKRPRNA
jgi:chorismate synthase